METILIKFGLLEFYEGSYYTTAIQACVIMPIAVCLEMPKYLAAIVMLECLNNV